MFVLAVHLVGDHEGQLVTTFRELVNAFDQMTEDDAVRRVRIRVAPPEPRDVDAADDDVDILRRDGLHRIGVDADPRAKPGA
ncbi:MAG: hypothetical protein L0I76_14090 [Pseudonocardia sp.]|nr:hypothetical protein [Pseudonocardia sp.]